MKSGLNPFAFAFMESESWRSALFCADAGSEYKSLQMCIRISPLAFQTSLTNKSEDEFSDPNMIALSFIGTVYRVSQKKVSNYYHVFATELQGYEILLHGGKH